ncbi:phage tail spike protein [Eubacteriaceae bacterium ES3]|nr:phage tail spike protein [Eubacteriaceae bacterium ES3]
MNLYNQSGLLIGELSQYRELYLTELLETGQDTLSFEIYVRHPFYKYLVEENLILTDDNRYVIKSIDERGQTTIIGCQLDLSDLSVDGYYQFLIEDATLSMVLSQVLGSLGWSFTGASSITTVLNFSFESGTTLELLEQVEKSYGVIFRYNCITRNIQVTTISGYSNKGVYFSDELNVKECELRGDSCDLVTRLYAFGKEGLTFEEINSGRAYVDNFQYTSKVITQVWVDTRYEIAEELLVAATKKIEALSIPNRVYTASVVDLASLLPDQYGDLSISIGDKVTLIDRIREIEIEHQIVKLITYPDSPEKNVAELGRIATDFESTITKLKNEEIKEVVDDTVPEAVDTYISEHYGQWVCVEEYPDVMEDNTLYLKYVSE